MFYIKFDFKAYFKNLHRKKYDSDVDLNLERLQ